MQKLCGPRDGAFAAAPRLHGHRGCIQRWRSYHTRAVERAVEEAAAHRLPRPPEVRRAERGGPRHRRRGDARGDLYFLLRTYAAPLECVPHPAHRAVCGNHSCGNAEIMGAPVLSQVEIEVDAAALATAQADLRTYSHCDLTQPGCKYNCSADGGEGKKLPAVGSWNISLLGGSGGGSCSRLKPGSLETEWWAANLQATLVGQHACFWYSTLKAGENVTWRQLALTKQIEKSCADRVFLNAVECSGKGVFAAAGAKTGAARDVKSPAWIRYIWIPAVDPLSESLLLILKSSRVRSFYATTLGPRSNTSYDRSGGWSAERMDEVWSDQFSVCPDVRARPHKRVV